MTSENQTTTQKPGNESSTTPSATSSTTPSPVPAATAEEMKHSTQDYRIIDVIHSEALKNNLLGENVDRNICVYLPPSYFDSDKKYPMLYYLHGHEIVHAVNLEYMTTNQQAEKVMAEYIPKMKNVINKDIYIGLVRYTERSEYSNYYVSGTEVQLGSSCNKPMVSYKIDTHEYAVFRYIGMHSPHQITFRALLGIYGVIDHWKLKTSYHQAAPFHFERVNLRICSEEYCEMDIYIPITL